MCTPLVLVQLRSWNASCDTGTVGLPMPCPASCQRYQGALDSREEQKGNYSHGQNSKMEPQPSSHFEIVATEVYLDSYRELHSRHGSGRGREVKDGETQLGSTIPGHQVPKQSVPGHWLLFLFTHPSPRSPGSDLRSLPPKPS